MLALEVVSLPVADVDRALASYTEQVGSPSTSTTSRPRSSGRAADPAGVGVLGAAGPAGSPVRVHDLYLVTSDLAAARDAHVARGVPVGPVRHKDPVDAWAGG